MSTQRSSLKIMSVPYVLCSDGSIDHNKYHFENIDTIQDKNVGPFLICSTNKCKTCSVCMLGFLKFIPETMRKRSTWCAQVTQFLKDKVQPVGFVCNHCQWNKILKESKVNEALLSALLVRQDGDIILPECAIIILSVKLGDGDADILLWPDYEGCTILPAMHSVINQKVSIDLKNLDIKPDGSRANVYSFDSDMEVPIPNVVLITQKMHKVSSQLSICFSLQLCAIVSHPCVLFYISV